MEIKVEKLNRITLLDDSKRPKAPKIEGLSAFQRSRGQSLKYFHDYHRAQLAEVSRALETLNASGFAEKVGKLDMSTNYRMFGNLCGQECQMLTGHHTIEDMQMFPQLHEEGSDGVKKVVERLMAEHLVVHELIEELEQRAWACLQNPSAETFAAAKETFKALNTCVRSHFGYEETELEDALSVIDVGI
ncbi:MAG: hemerythrin domain-containing protein [Aestuariivirga sp.]